MWGYGFQRFFLSQMNGLMPEKIIFSNRGLKSVITLATAFTIVGEKGN